MLINLLLIIQTLFGLKQNQRRLSEICLCINRLMIVTFFWRLDSKKLISVQFSEHNFLVKKKSFSVWDQKHQE